MLFVLKPLGFSRGSIAGDTDFAALVLQ
ncbi:MAG: hypothetical protein JWM68_5163, partial [Verrucomicrobiales bacterium]|nr:hypothetical protein [Verrucomicrobiales bacterium]